MSWNFHRALQSRCASSLGAACRFLRLTGDFPRSAVFILAFTSRLSYTGIGLTYEDGGLAMLRSSGVYLSGSGGGRGAAPLTALVSDTSLFDDSLDLYRAHRWPQDLPDCSGSAGILLSNMRPADAFRLHNAVRVLAPALGPLLSATPESTRQSTALSRFMTGASLAALRLILRALPFGRTAALSAVEVRPSGPGSRRLTELPARRAHLAASVLSGRVLTFSELATNLAALGEASDHEATRIAVDSLSIAGRLEMVPGVQETWTGRARCSRCGSQSVIQYTARCEICRRRCAMCLCCSSLGLMTSCTWLLHIPAGDRSDAVACDGSRGPNVSLNIPFELTKAQRKASRRVQEFVSDSQSEEFLVWAACGSGKTEVVCGAIEYVLNRGGTVLYVVPRRSAAGDIHARLERFFRGIRIGLQSGSRRVAAQGSPFLVCTAHQTLRLRHVADLVVFDEVDAYPCVPGGFLESAVKRSVRSDGKIVYLTATPDSSMFGRVRNKSLPFCLISTRHHGRPVPVPSVLCVRTTEPRAKRPCVAGMLDADQECPFADINRPAANSRAADSGETQVAFPKQCLCRMAAGAAARFTGAAPFGRAAESPRGAIATLRGPSSSFSGDSATFRPEELCLLCAAAVDPSPTLVFVPTIRLVERARGILGEFSERCWPDARWGFCHSKTSDSEGVLTQLREGGVTSVVTTTVLERGITVSGVNVIVLRADSSVFDARSLVQMAGRAGRTSECPTGSVVFAVERTTTEVETAIKMIEFMNDRLVH